MLEAQANAVRAFRRTQILCTIIALIGGLLCGAVLRNLFEDSTHCFEDTQLVVCALFIVTSFGEMVTIFARCPPPVTCVMSSSMLIIWFVCAAMNQDLYTGAEPELMAGGLLAKMILSISLIYRIREDSKPEQWAQVCAKLEPASEVSGDSGGPPSKV